MKIDNRWFHMTWKSKKPAGTVLPLLLCAALLAGSFGGGLWLGGRDGGESVQETVEDSQVAEVEDTSEDGDGEASVLPAISAQEDRYVEGTYVSSTYLARSVLNKYGETISPYGYTYGPSIIGLHRDENIELQAGFAVEDAGIVYWAEMMELYQDPQLTKLINCGVEYDNDIHAIALTPPNSAVGTVVVSSLDTVTAGKYEHDGTKLFPHDAGSDWGNLSTMYLVFYLDLETGEKLEIPQVRIVTMEGELPDSPQLYYSFTDDGRVRLNWTRVEGAEEYFICNISYREDQGLNGPLWVMDITTETEWTSAASQYGDILANSGFRNYTVSEEQWYDERWAKDRIAEYGEEPVYLYEEEDRTVYCVIAVSREGTSMMSNYVDILDIQSNIPVSIAYNTWRANGYSPNGYDTTEEVVPYSYVTMADGSTAMKLVDYDMEKAMVMEERYVFLDQEGNFQEARTIKVLRIPYHVEGTPFEDVAKVVDYDESRLEEDLRYLEEREDMLRKRAGDVALNSDIEFEEDETAAEEVRKVEEIPVTANSALSEYLALNMLSGVRIIDVSDFREAADTTLLVDAFLEAYYQNPLILGISGYRINRRGTAVKVAYDETAEDQARKQEEIREKVAEIIDEIIEPGMTELEKELAINAYLCDTCVYDDEALVSAQENDFQNVDEEFNDSFTAYGALIDGRCVCSGYAAAFKLLADAAGLNSVVVTGQLEGTMSHAWNKVRIDGDWEILDVTNNDNEYLVNALLNLPDEAGRRILTEDSDYAMDGYLHNYASTNGQKEYYRVNQLYFSYDEIAEKLAEQLNENGTALLRTEYALNDEIFNRIGQELYDHLETRELVYGYYWMGVIYLTY